MARTGAALHRPRKVTIATLAFLVVLAIVITIFAVRSDGYAVSEVDANNGGVWVMNGSKGLVGRINVDAQELDAKLQTDSAADIQQSDSTVFTRTTRGAERVNAAALRLEGQIELAPSDVVAVGGDRVAVRMGDGKLWVLTADQMGAFDPTGLAPTAELAGAGPVVVGHDGTVYALDKGTLRVFDRSLATPAVPENAQRTIELGDVGSDDTLSLTVVDDVPVVLDGEKGALVIGDDAKHVSLSDAGVADAGSAVLQQPSVHGTEVLLATSDSLVKVPLSGGKAQRSKSSGNGQPVAPVQAAGCIYGAWKGANTYLTQCGSADATGGAIDRAGPEANLALRVNHELVVLNDQDDGLSWMIADKMQIVEQWDLKTELKTDQVEEEKKETLTSSVTNVAPDQREENRFPVANPDTFGVRPGATVVLPVTQNDTDPDGDILVVTPSDQPAIGAVTPIQGGTSLQIVVAPEAAGTASFSYEAADGRGGTATAVVTLEVRPPEVNEGPQPVDGSVPRLTIAQGATVSYNVAPHFRDPDGDAFYLAAAHIDSTDDIVTFRPDGLLTFNDAGLTTGDKSVRLTFRDMRGGTSNTEMIFTVSADHALPPVTTPDHLQVIAGRTVQLEPLVNDLNPGGGELDLAFVGGAENLTVTPDLEAGTVDIRGDIPGPAYVTYQAGAGADTVQGLIRVDIEAPTAEAMNPVPVDDIALVTSGRSTLVDPIANDVDPTGGVLVVNSAQADPATGLIVTVLDHHLLRVEAAPDAPIGDAPIVVPYQVSNATGTATGTLRVMVVPPDTQFANPVAVPDRSTVRAGDLVKIPVLDNDRSPSASQLTLTSVDQSGLAGRGEVEIVEDQARFRAAPGTSGEVTFGYVATDETGRTGSSTVTLQIVPESDPNDAPVPENSEARTLAGTTARIPVRTSGIDPDGDSTLLTGLTGDPPTLGRVVRATGEYIEYQAYETSSGTDTITYQVMDSQGAVGTAQITVGIAKPSAQNLPPVTRADTIMVRPGRALQMHVLANDTDPEGEPLQIDRSLTTPGPGIVLAPPVDEKRIPSLDTTAPMEPGSYSVPYGATDGQLSAPGAATVIVDEDAELQAPIARDDYVDATEVTDQSSDTVPVDVLANDQDPDGSVEGLVPVLEDGGPEGAEVLPTGIVHVPKADEQQRIRYTITDQDGKSSSAFIWVPGRNSQIPRWVGGPVQARAGQPVDIDLRDPENVRVRAGAAGTTITDLTAAKAAHNDGGDLVVDPHTLRYTAAADYAGEDTITVPVTDSDDPADPAGAQGTLQVPIVVTSEQNLPPTVRGAAFDVPKGEAAVAVDLAAGAEDPEGDPLTFTIGEHAQPPGVTVAQQGGSVITVQAAPDAEIGTVLEIPFTASDGTNEPQSATARITVTGSERLKPQTAADTVAVDVGTDATVPVIDNDFNPFPEKDLEVVDATTVAGDVSAHVQDNQVVLSAQPGFHGVATVTYRVKDATGEEARMATGTITANVRDVPEAPSAPRILQEGDGTVELTFVAGRDNGAPITGYIVRQASGPAVSAECGSTTCGLTGLTNGAEYSFTVVAVNAVGESPASSASAVARPDVRPDPPAAPATVRLDGELDVTWSPPANRGSALTGYELQISGPTGATETREFGPGTRTTRWSGLTNGVDYRFRIRASNGAKEPSEWSAWSAAQHPAGLPKTPAGTPRASRENIRAGRVVTVEFPAMSRDEANGEPITQYVVRSSGGQERTVDAGQTSVTFNELDPNTNYTFTYTGVNSVGRGPGASKASNSVLPHSVPDAPPAPTATVLDSDPSGKVTVKWQEANSNGTTLKTYRITWAGGSRTVDANTREVVIDGLRNGTDYRFRVQADNGNPDGQSQLSAESAPARPYTDPGRPSVSGQAGQCSSQTSCTVVFTASLNGDGGAPPAKLEYNIGGGWRTYSGPVTATGGSGQALTMEVRATNGKERTATNSATTNAPRSEPTVPGGIVWQGGTGPQEGCEKGGCYYFTFTVENLPPGSHTMTFSHKGAENYTTVQISPDGSGKYTLPGNRYYFGNPASLNDPLIVRIDGKEVVRGSSPG